MKAAHDAGIHLVRLADAPRQRWRNGGGWTRELLAWPGPDHWRARVSVADIESDGPFSGFPGVTRFFCVLQGAGVELTIDGQATRVTPTDAAVRFPGEANTTCRMQGGPTRDLNLMVRGPGGAMERVSAGRVWNPAAPSCGVYALAAGPCRAGDATFALPAAALLWFERAPASVVFDADGWWLAA